MNNSSVTIKHQGFNKKKKNQDFSNLCYEVMLSFWF